MTVAELLGLLRERGETVATCESMTGGLVCAALTSVPGSSDVVRGGLVTYATDLKTALVGVPTDLVESYGVVSRQVAESMAEGVRQVCGSDWGVSVTGVAGPTGQEGQAPGSVWVAVSGRARTDGVRLHLAGDRDSIRAATVEAVLDVLGSRLTSP